MKHFKHGSQFKNHDCNNSQNINSFSLLVFASFTFTNNKMGRNIPTITDHPTKSNIIELGQCITLNKIPIINVIPPIRIEIFKSVRPVFFRLCY